MYADDSRVGESRTPQNVPAEPPATSRGMPLPALQGLDFSITLPVLSSLGQGLSPLPFASHMWMMRQGMDPTYLTSEIF